VNDDVSDSGTTGVGFTLRVIFKRIPCQQDREISRKGFAGRRRGLNADNRTFCTASPLRFPLHSHGPPVVAAPRHPPAAGQRPRSRQPSSPAELPNCWLGLTNSRSDHGCAGYPTALGSTTCTENYGDWH